MFNHLIKSNLIGGVVWFLLGIAICGASIKLKIGTLHTPGPGFIGFISGGALLLLGLSLIYLSLTKRLKVGKDDKDTEIFKKLNWKRLLLVTVILWAYILSFKSLGFVPSTFLFFFVLLLNGSPERKKWFIPFVISGCTAVLSYFIFSAFLGVQLPIGIFNG